MQFSTLDVHFIVNEYHNDLFLLSIFVFSIVSKSFVSFAGLPAEQPVPKKSSSKSKNTDNNGTKKKKTRSVHALNTLNNIINVLIT